MECASKLRPIEICPYCANAERALQTNLAQINRRISEITEDIAAQRRYIEERKAQGLGTPDVRLSLAILETLLQHQMKERDKLAAELG